MNVLKYLNFRRVSLLIFSITLIASNSYAQKIAFDPVDWQPSDAITISVDFSGTSFDGYVGNIYLWSWVKNGAKESIDSPNNGVWTNSSSASLLSGTGNVRTITLTPTVYFGFSKEHLSVSGINFLFKTINGSQQSENFEGIKPFSSNGIIPNTNWTPSKKIRLLVDVSGTPLSGTTDPLYYWGWYNNGGGNINSPNNGTWSSSSAASLLTRIGATSTYYIDFVPTSYFATAASNLTPTTLFGLIKKADGNNGKTDDFGLSNPYKKYTIQQLNASNVELTPSLPAANVPLTFKFTAQQELLNTSASVFMHTGVVTENLSSTTWSHTQGIWGDSLTSSGKMTRSVSNPNEYTLTIPSINSYYGLGVNEKAYKIMAVFRSADGSIVEKDGSSDYQLEVSASRYLEMREPSGTFITKTINKPFRITGYSNSTSTFTIKVNGVTVKTEAGVNRSTHLYTPTVEGTYTISIEANDGSGTLTKTSNVVVCANTSIDLASALPAGLQYGINYNPTDFTKATLVLHAPTQSIKSVHVIGDFNNWVVNCSYLMNWDATKKVFWKELTGLTSGQEYVFQYLIDGQTRIGDPYTEKVSDPWNDSSIPSSTYPNLIQYPALALPQNGETPTIASVLKTNQLDYNWEITTFNRISQDKLNIYQLHFRDFTTEGTYLAAIQKLDYVKRMGINAIETLPVSEFEGNDSWGYNPNFYFAVDKAYGTKDDYKKFVDECHKRGISVIGDIVLNHAFGTNPHARMYWDNLRNRPASNNPWFNATRNFVNNGIADWGVDFNHDSGHTQAFVDSVVSYWLHEYKIDGIRFDFTKGFSNTIYPNAGCSDEWGGCYDASRVANLTRMANKMWAINNGSTGSQPYVIFEHLAQAAEDKYLTEYGNGILLWSGVSPNHKYGEIAMGWAPTIGDPNKSNLNDVYYKNKTFANPTWVSYMESHDEERLAYLQTAYGSTPSSGGVYDLKTNLDARSKFLKAAAVMNLLFRGPRQLWQFGELGYDYSINYNGRTGKKPVRWDYFDVPERKGVYELYSRLFWLRNKMPLTFHKDFDNPSGTKTDLVSQFKRYHFYSSVGDTAVTIIANTANSVITGNPDFNASTATQWYEFISNQWMTVNSSITLQPGEYRVFFNKKPTFTLPLFSMTSLASPTVGNSTTDIQITFDEPVVKTVEPNYLGKKLDNAEIHLAFTLKNSLNASIPFAGNISSDDKAITIDPTSDLDAGTYTLTLLADSVHNFGGIKIGSNTVYTFTVQATGPPCLTSKTFSSPTDDFTSEIIHQKTSTFIEATNKVSGSSKIIYDAKNNVLLLPGFEASTSSGAVFEAKINGVINKPANLFNIRIRDEIKIFNYLHKNII